MENTNFKKTSHIFTLPTAHHIDPTNRVIKFRFVKINVTSITVPGTVLEATLPSGSNIASEAKVWVDTANYHLQQLRFTGDSMHLGFTKALFEGNLNLGSQTLASLNIDLRFSLTNFQDITDTLAKKLGFADKSSVPELKKSMSIAELKAFFAAHSTFNMYIPTSASNA